MIWRRAFLLLASLTSLSCFGSETTDHPDSASDTTFTPDIPTRGGARSDDSIRVAQFVELRGFRLEKLVARRGSNYAAILKEHITGRDHVVALRVLEDSLVELHKPMVLGDYPPSELNFYHLGRDSLLALIITFDSRIEGVVGSVIFGIDGANLTKIYNEEQGSCRPAKIRDLNEDGEFEVLSYVEDPSNGDCGDPCHFRLWDRFGVVPGWVRILAWRDRGWTDVSSTFPDFYRDLAEDYEHVLAWINGGHDDGVCSSVYWYKDASFESLAARARRLAGRH